MPVVHPVAEAVLEDGAGGTLAATGPGPVREAPLRKFLNNLISLNVFSPI